MWRAGWAGGTWQGGWAFGTWRYVAGGLGGRHVRKLGAAERFADAPVRPGLAPDERFALARPG
jgi:hypothetical protein